MNTWLKRGPPGLGGVGDVERSQLDARVPARTNVAAATDQCFDESGITRATYRSRFSRIGDGGHPRTGKRTASSRPGLTSGHGPGWTLPAQLFHQRPQLRPAVTATDQKREQAAFAHRDR